MIYFLLKAFYFPFILMNIPILLIASCILLYFRLGVIGLVCIGLLVILIPLQLYLGNKSMSYLKEKNNFTDERIKFCNESIAGIRLIKMYAWENAFLKIIDSIRKSELYAIFKFQLTSIIV